MDEHGALFTLELLKVSSALGAAGDTVCDIALEVLRGAVRAALREGVAADLAHLEWKAREPSERELLRAVNATG
jgi:hypothetical protein